MAFIRALFIQWAALVFWILLSCSLVRADEPIDIVLHMDGIVFKEVGPNAEGPWKDSFWYNGHGSTTKRCVLNPAARPFLESLSKLANVRISLITSDNNREMELLPKILRNSDAFRTQFEEQDFSETLKGPLINLLRIRPDIKLNNTLLIDTTANSVLPAQRRNLLLVDSADPAERLALTRGIVEETLERVRGRGESVPQALQSIRSEVSLSGSPRRNSLRQKGETLFTAAEKKFVPLKLGNLPPIKSQLESEVPTLDQVQPIRHHGLGRKWERTKKALWRSIPIFTEVYPSHEIFVMDRDATMLRLALQAYAKVTNDSALAERVKGLNVSRANMNDPLLKEYVAQQGISLEALEAGKKFLLVDSGFFGTIPEKIISLFPAKYREQFQIHMMTASPRLRIPIYPSMREVNYASTSYVLRAFLSIHGGITPQQAYPNEVWALAGHPKAMGRSTHFEKVDGKIVPANDSFNRDEWDGITDDKPFRELLEDLSSSIQQPETLATVERGRRRWAKALALYRKRDTDGLIGFFKQLKKQIPPIPFSRTGFENLGFVGDFLELTRTNLFHPDYKLDFQATLAAIEAYPDFEWDSRKIAISPAAIFNTKFWHLRRVWMEPGKEFHRMIEAGDFAKLRWVLNKVEEFQDTHYGQRQASLEYLQLLGRSLADECQRPEVLEFVKDFDQNDSDVSSAFLQALIQEPHSRKHQEALKTAVFEGPLYVRQVSELMSHVLSVDHPILEDSRFREKIIRMSEAISDPNDKDRLLAQFQHLDAQSTHPGHLGDLK